MYSISCFKNGQVYNSESNLVESDKHRTERSNFIMIMQRQLVFGNTAQQLRGQSYGIWSNKK